MATSSPPRAVWTGAITFGLVVLPCRLYTATEEHAVRLREIHKVDAGRIRHRRVCEIDGQEVPYEDVGRGYELADAGVVPLTERDLERLPLPTRHQINVLGFVPADDVNPIRFAKPYFVAPDGESAQHAYTLLTAALAHAGAVAVCKVAVRSRERLAVLRPRHGMLVLHTLLWPDEIREPHGLAPATPVTERELQLAVQLIGELAGVDTDELHDEYREALEQLVNVKTFGGQIEPPPMPQPTEDLLAVLEESVRSARHARRNGSPS
ncbi:Ku protein [Streptomyces chattanoogensis]|uniref:non-homologous end joining protein Ku n=1 Tax=Streptomyces chattanoogensis TaxID=66876 RepID=UPI00368A4F10